jgi:hypothetical protein
MIIHHCFWMCDAYWMLECSIQLLTAVARGHARMDVSAQRETAKSAVEKVIGQGLRLGWQLSDRIRADQLLRDLDNGTQFSAETLVRELNGLRTSFHVALQTAKFAYLPAPDAKYFEDEKLFGDEVFAVFDDARQDVRDTGNCLAFGLYTACVFHLMRISEFGLRRLARRLGVRLTDKSQPQPLEYAVWDKVIKAVHSKLEDARKLPAGPKRQLRLTRFAEAGDHCTFMKDIWRNSVSHARRPYDRDEALAAFDRVRDFMKFLAKDIGASN